MRQNASHQFLLSCKFDSRKGSRYLAYATVQSQLSHDHELFQQRKFSLAGGSNDSQGNRYIISAALLVHVGRRQVDDYLLSGNTETHRL